MVPRPRAPNTTIAPTIAGKGAALAALAVLALGPLACSKPKEAPEIPVVDDDAGREPEPSTPAVASPPKEVPSLHLRVSARELDDLFAWVGAVTDAWLGEPVDVDTQAQAMLLQLGYGPGMWTSLDWRGVMAVDLRLPLVDDPDPRDFQLFGTLATPRARAVLDAVPEGRRPQPLGDGLWELVDDGRRVVLREQPAALEFALEVAALDQAPGLLAPALAGRRIQGVADGFPEGWLDLRDFIGGGDELRALQGVAARAEEVRVELDAGTDRDLQVYLGARAPFARLGLDPLGSPRRQASALEGRLPGSPVVVLAIPWGDPALLHATLDRLVPLEMIPAPFDAVARDVVAAGHTLLGQIRGDVVVGLYVPASGRVSLLIAAEVGDEAASAGALATIQGAMKQTLDGYRELAGGAAEASFKVTSKTGGAKLVGGKGDLLRIAPPKGMASDLAEFGAFLNKRGELEVVSGAASGIAVLALGGGAADLLSDSRGGTLAGHSGLAQARSAADGCQLCLGVDPMGVARLLTILARDRAETPATKREYAAILGELAALGDLGGVGVGVQLQPEAGALALGIPRTMLAPAPARAEALRTLLERALAITGDGAVVTEGRPEGRVTLAR